MSEPRVFYHQPTPGTINRFLQDIVGLDALVLDCSTVFPSTGDESLYPIIEKQINRGTAVFLISGQNGEYEQQEMRKRLQEAQALGAVQLGNCYERPDRLMKSIIEIFSQDVPRDESVNEVQRRFLVPVLEAGEYGPFLDFMINGGSLEFGKFAYADFAQWLSVKKSPSYRKLSDATESSSQNLVSKVVSELIDRGIHDFYSMGPSANIDKKILEESAKRSHKITYHAIDVNTQALVDTRKDISNYLDEVSPGWQDSVALENTRSQLFQDVKSREKSLVSYPGGQIVNSDDLLTGAKQICQDGGLVLADLHIREGQNNDSALWKHFYDISAEKEMFRRGVLQVMPWLKDEKGWHIIVKYEKDSPYKISFQLGVDREIETGWNGIAFTLRPGVTRELMMSKKYTRGEFTDEANREGFDVLVQAEVPVRYQGISGYGATALLAYTGKNKRQRKDRAA
jgi:hypothetical protein